MSSISRREAIVAATAGVTLGGSSLQGAANPGRKRAIRVAHVTDVHIQRDLRASEGFAACLRHIHHLADPPQLILQGGDAVLDVCSGTAAEAKIQADLWHQVLKAECSIPIEHCIGNHDIWGIDRAKSQTTGKEPNWGKRWAMELMGLSNPYHTFDRAGWRFIVLDSMTVVPTGYVARLDAAQFNWLRATLQATDRKTPVVVLSHIPILSAAAYFDGENERTGDWRVPGQWMHIDARAIKSLFAEHPNVKLCLSGHLHLVDRVDYAGVTYLCNGAVCARWWQGPNQEFNEGYGLIDLYTDGTFEHQYVEFGWKARA